MKYCVLLSALMVIFSAPAFAQDVSDFAPEQLGDDRPARPASSQQAVLIPAGLLYASFDTDGDYATSRTELTAGILRSFTRADGNGNGRVSLVELESWREAVLGSRDRLPGNTQFDKNFDSQIDGAEFSAVLTDMFESFDRNENGALEFSEMTRTLRRPQQKSRQKRERPSIADRQNRRPRGY